ncbi:MAG: glycosyltransferase family 4 protein [Prolixibacteraceae bacterium]|nr:glycosyltransferase family 4 protein [Prolixibacteraceae bacterium]
MNILFISQLFPFKKGEINTTGALREFIEQWANSGNTIKVIRVHYSHEKEEFPSISSYNIGNNIIVDFIKPIRIPVLKLSFYNNNKIINGLGFKPDIIVCHHYNAYFTFYKLAKKLNIPLVAGIHMSDVRLAQKLFYRWHFKRIYKQVSAFACRSQSYFEQFSKLFPEYRSKAFLALSGIPKKYLKSFESMKNVDNDRLHFITVSSLIKRKQVDKILIALSALPVEIKWSFSIIGEGPEKSNLLELANKLKIIANINFLGNINRDNVFEQLKMADIFILPSYNETFGLVYLEAMAAGCITIGSCKEGIDGIIINNDNGFLCNPFDQYSINQIILQASQINNSDKIRIRKNAFKTVANYSNSRMADNYLNKLKEVVHDYNKTKKRIG